MIELLHTIDIETAPNPDFAVIWMHGLGADATDFLGVVPQLGLPKTAAVRFVFPNAPVRPITLNGGHRMRAWFDITSLDGINRQADEAGVKVSVAAIRQLIAREESRGVAASRVVVAGFSQGGAMAYTVGLTHPEPLAGIMALSAFIPAPAVIEAATAASKHPLPVFAAHGTVDDIVKLKFGEMARDFAKERGHVVGWHTYLMGHSVCVEEIAAIGAWLRGLIN